MENTATIAPDPAAAASARGATSLSESGRCDANCSEPSCAGANCNEANCASVACVASTPTAIASTMGSGSAGSASAVASASGVASAAASRSAGSLSAAPAPFVDRRRSVRNSYTASAWLSAETGTRDANMQVTVFDLSLHGLGFTSDTLLQVDAVHWIVIGGSGLRASSRVRIASCRPREDGRYDCGGEFF